MKKPRLPKAVKTEKDLRDFFKYLILVDRASFHPDDDLAEYGHSDEHGKWIPLYTKAQAAARNALMEQSWELVRNRIYDIAIEMMDTYGAARRGPKDWTPYDS